MRSLTLFQTLVDVNYSQVIRIYIRDQIWSRNHYILSLVCFAFQNFWVFLIYTTTGINIISVHKRKWISKVLWNWLKHWACHAQSNFKIEMGAVGYFKPHPWKFAKSIIFMFYWNFLWLLIYKRAGLLSCPCNSRSPWFITGIYSNFVSSRSKSFLSLIGLNLRRFCNIFFLNRCPPCTLLI